MKSEFKKDLRHHYMVISEFEQETRYEYCIKLLEHVRIEGILPMEQKSLDSKLLFYYDITSRQPMNAILDKIALSRDQIRRICKDIINTLERAYDYLLPEEDFILKPDFLYMEVVSNRTVLCFLPGYGKPVKEQLSSLLEYLMNKVDYNDREAVLLVYRLYAVSREEGYTLGHLLKEMEEPLQITPEPNITKIGLTKIDENRLCKKDKPLTSDAQRGRELQGESTCLDYDMSTVANRRNSLRKEEVIKKEELKNNIPVMMEKLECEKELSYYPITTYLLTALSMAGGILIVAFCLKIKLIYNTYGDQLDYTKLAALLLIILCLEGYLLKIIWDKKSKMTRIVEKNEYVDPRQFIDPDISKSFMSTISRLREKNMIHNQESSNPQDDFGEKTEAEPSKPVFPPKEQRQKEREEKELDNPTCLLNDSYLTSAESVSGEPSKGCILRAINDKEYQTISITSFPFFIGKLKKNVDFCLEKDVVSRYHAKLIKEDEAYYIMDMNSTNGTFVNGTALKTYEKKEVKQGDEISFANISYRFEISSIDGVVY